MYRKNTAGQFVCFQMILTASGAIATGLSPAVRRCIDGTFAAGAGSITEDTGTGGYKFAMAQADTNGNNISFFFTATGAIPVCVNIVTTVVDPASANFGMSNVSANLVAVNAHSVTDTSSGILDVNAKNINNATAATPPTVAQIATGIWQDTTAGDFTAANSIGKSVMNGVALGTGLTVNGVTTAITLPTIPNDWIAAAGIAAGALDGKGNWNIGKTGYTVSTVSDKTGYSLSQTFPTNFSSLAIDGSGNVTFGNASIGTVTTLTNLPAIPDNWLTAAGINAAALNGKGDWNVGKTGYTVSTVSDKTGYALTTTERTDIADALLDRDMSTGLDSGSPTVRTVRQALRFLRNKISIAGGTLTVTKENDSTTSWTSAVTTDANALPIITSDPAS